MLKSELKELKLVSVLNRLIRKYYTKYNQAKTEEKRKEFYGYFETYEFVQKLIVDEDDYLHRICDIYHIDLSLTKEEKILKIIDKNRKSIFKASKRPLHPRKDKFLLNEIQSKLTAYEEILFMVNNYHYLDTMCRLNHVRL